MTDPKYDLISLIQQIDTIRTPMADGKLVGVPLGGHAAEVLNNSAGFIQVVASVQQAMCIVGLLPQTIDRVKGPLIELANRVMALEEKVTKAAEVASSPQTPMTSPANKDTDAHITELIKKAKEELRSEFNIELQLVKSNTLERVAAIEKRVDQMAENAQQSTKKVDQAINGLDKIAETNSRMEGMLVDMRKTVAEADARMKDIQRMPQVADSSNLIKDLSEKMRALSTRVEGVAQNTIMNLSKMQGTIATMEGAVKRMPTQKELGDLRQELCKIINDGLAQTTKSCTDDATTRLQKSSDGIRREFVKLLSDKCESTVKKAEELFDTKSLKLMNEIDATQNNLLALTEKVRKLKEYDIAECSIQATRNAKALESAGKCLDEINALLPAYATQKDLTVFMANAKAEIMEWAMTNPSTSAALMEFLNKSIPEMVKRFETLALELRKNVLADTTAQLASHIRPVEAVFRMLNELTARTHLIETQLFPIVKGTTRVNGKFVVEDQDEQPAPATKKKGKK